MLSRGNPKNKKQENKTMKKVISAILVCFLLVGSMLALVACNGGGGIANGTYVYESEHAKITLKVSGDELTMTQESGEDVVKYFYTYELNEAGDKVKLTPTKAEYDGENESIKAGVGATNAAIEALKSLEGTALDAALEELVQEGAYEKTENGIKLENIEYVKQ